MKRIFFLVISLLFFTCGCSAHYELTLGEKVEEVNHVYTKENSSEVYQNVDLNRILNSYLQSYVPVYYDENDGVEIGSEKNDGVEYYNLAPYKNGGFEGFTSSYQFDYSNIYRSRIIKECFDEISVQKNDTVYRINTSTGCKAYKKYSLLEDLTIDVKTDYDVISSNADEVKDNHYYWYFNKNNYSSKNISFVFNNKKIDLSGFEPGMRVEPSTSEKIRDYASEHAALIIFIMFLVFGVLISTLIIIKNKKK